MKALKIRTERIRARNAPQKAPGCDRKQLYTNQNVSTASSSQSETYKEMSSVLFALCITTSLAASLPEARSTMRGIRTKTIGTAASGRYT